MAAPVFTTGQVLTAAHVNSWLKALGETKTADETVNNSAALQDDNHLVVPVEANATYLLFLSMTVFSPAAADFKFNLVGLAGSSFQGDTVAVNAVAAAFGTDDFDLRESGTGDVAPRTAGTDQSINVRGVYRTSGTSGNLTVRWAQNTAVASDTIVRAGSSILLVRVA